MKYPRELIIKLKNDKELHINLINTMYDFRVDVFRATVEISRQLVESELDKDIAELITEEKEF